MIHPFCISHSVAANSARKDLIKLIGMSKFGWNRHTRSTNKGRLKSSKKLVKISGFGIKMVPKSRILSFRKTNRFKIIPDLDNILKKKAIWNFDQLSFDYKSPYE